MDMRQLKHFVAVAERGNMVGAARMVHVTQSTLSKSVAALEERLGVRLFNRGPRGVTPTAYGEKLLTHAKLILSQARRTEEDIRALVDGTGGHVRIGFGANFAGFMLPQAILKVVSGRPGITVSIISKPFDELLPMLREGDLDLAVVVFPPEQAQPGLTYEPLIVSEFCTVCRPSHPLAGKRRIELPELSRQAWVLFDRPKAMQILFATVFLDHDLQPPQPVIATSSVFFLKSALMQGDYLSFIPPGLVYEEIRAGSLVKLPTEIPAIKTTAGIVCRTDDVLPAAASDVVDELRAMRTSVGGRGVATHVLKAI
jgi:DNA-binding transcriptional LysR family regulator